LPEQGPFAAFIKPYVADIQYIYHDHWTGQAFLTSLQKIKFLRGFYRSARAIAAYAKKQQAEVVLTNTSVIVAGALGARLAGLPHVWYLHEFVVEDHALVWQYGQRFSYWVINQLSELVIVNSRALFDKVQRYVAREKLQIIYNAAATDWAPLETSEITDEPIILMAGALHAGKNQELAIKALAEKPLAALGAKLLLIGHGPEEEKQRLLGVAEALGVESRVVIRPFLEDRRAVFAQGRILLVASRSEAFGRVTVEAQKSGLPVLASKAGASKELIADEESGLLFNSDDAAHLAAQAARLLTDDALRARVRENAMRVAQERYSLVRHGDALAKTLADSIRKYAARD
jgi:glycosyltransferase involved in cell wall biosynthesis